MHPRTLIRAKFLELIDSIYVFKGSTYESRVYPVSASKLPVALVYTPVESNSQVGYDYSDELTRETTVNVEILANGGDLEIDSLCEKIEIIIANDEWLNKEPISCYLANTNIDPSGAGEKSRVIATMRFQISLLGNKNPNI